MGKELETAYKLAKSGLLENIVVTRTLTRDYVCDHFGCPSEEYVPSDWEETLTVCDDLTEFLQRYNTSGIRSVKVTGEIDGCELLVFVKEKKK